MLAAASVTTAVLMTATALVAPTRDTPTIDALPLPEPATVERTFWPAPRITTPPPETEVVLAETTAASPTAEEPPPPPPEPEPEPEPEPKAAPAEECPTELAGTKPHVAQAGHHIAQRFGVPLSSIGGYRASARDRNGHPAGLALDFMVGRSTGDAINAYLLEHRDALGVEYTIWQQTYYSLRDLAGRLMEDRGSPTQNHLDHVHAQFNAAPGPGLPC